MLPYSSWVQDGFGFAVGGGSGSGTVTSVDASIDALFSVSGVPITTSGTIDFTINTVSANRAFLGPVSGGDAAPTFRAMKAQDLNSTFTNGDALVTDGSGNLSWATVGGTGTVTSVGLALPVSVFSVSGSPVTGSGTLTGAFATQTAHAFFLGPASGSPAAPTFRAAVASDFNTTFSNGQYLKTDGSGVLSWANPGTVTSVAMTVPSFLSVSGSPITTSGTLAVTLATQVKNLVFAGPVSGANAAPTFRALKADDMNATYTNGQFLTTDGSGNLSWASGSGGSVAGSDTQVQYNASGSFGADSNFTFDYTNKHLDVTHPVASGSSYTAKFINNVVSGSTNKTVWIEHGDTSGGSNALFIKPSAGASATSVASAIYIEGFGGSSGTDIVVTSAEGRTSAYLQRFTSGLSTPAILIVREIDTTASSLIDAQFYTGSVNKSIFQVWGAAADSGAGRGAVGFRKDGPPTNGVVEMPWITGDNKPTLFIGDASATTAGIKIATGTGTTQSFVVDASGDPYIQVLGSGLTQVRTGGQSSKMTSVGGMLYADNTDHANNLGVETTLASYSLDAASLATNADTIRITATFVTAANNANKTIKLKLNSTTIYTTGALVANADTITIEAIITRTGSNAQRCNTRMVLDNGAGTTVVQNQYIATTETDSSAISITTTGQGSSTNDVTETMFMVEFLNHFA